MASSIDASTSGAGGVITTADNTGILQLKTAGTTAVTVDASQNVGIGTTSPTSILQVQATTPIITINGTGDNVARGINYQLNGTTYASTTLNTNSGEFAISSGQNGTGFYTTFKTGNGTERMRLTSDGELWVARTTDAGAYNIQCGGTGVWGAGAYVNGSDARIKDNIEPISSSIEIVCKLNPVTYKYKEDWSKDRSTQTGFIAQELLEVLDGQNYIDGIVQQGGDDGYYSVAYQNIIPILTKAIQEQQTIINDLKARVTALEAK